MFEYRAYAGLDVHKETIATPVEWPGPGEPEYRGILPKCRNSLNQLTDNLRGSLGEALSFVYEAGPRGYGICREITDIGHDCQVWWRRRWYRGSPGIGSRRQAEAPLLAD